MKKMPRSKNGPRSNFSFLPFELRFKIIGMIQDGCTSSAIASDPEVKRAFSNLGSTFNRATMTRIKKSAEYKEIAAKRSARKAAEYDDRILTALLKENASCDTIAEQTKVALLRALSDLSNLLATAKQREDGSDLSDTSDKIKALRQITQSVAALSDQHKDNQLAALRRKLAEKDALFSAAETEWKAREAELLVRIAELENNTASGMSAETLERVEEKIRLL